MPITVRGTTGEVRVGGRVAAELRSWKLAKTSLNWALLGEAGNIDSYWLSRPGPFQVWLVVGKRRWCLQADTVKLDENELEIEGMGDVEVR